MEEKIMMIAKKWFSMVICTPFMEKSFKLIEVTMVKDTITYSKL